MARPSDGLDIALLENDRIPEAAKSAYVSSLARVRELDHDLAIKTRQIDLERRKFWWSMPLTAAVAGAITLSLSLFFGLIEIDREAQNTRDIERLQFQYRIIEAELSSDKSEQERVDSLLFLARSGILDGLNTISLIEMSERFYERNVDAPRVSVPSLGSPAVFRPSDRGFEQAHVSFDSECWGVLISPESILTVSDCVAGSEPLIVRGFISPPGDSGEQVSIAGTDNTSGLVLLRPSHADQLRVWNRVGRPILPTFSATRPRVGSRIFVMSQSVSNDGRELSTGVTEDCTVVSVSANRFFFDDCPNLWMDDQPESVGIRGWGVFLASTGELIGLTSGPNQAVPISAASASFFLVADTATP